MKINSAAVSEMLQTLREDLNAYADKYNQLVNNRDVMKKRINNNLTRLKKKFD